MSAHRFTLVRNIRGTNILSQKIIGIIIDNQTLRTTKASTLGQRENLREQNVSVRALSPINPEKMSDQICLGTVCEIRIGFFQ